MILDIALVSKDMPEHGIDFEGCTDGRRNPKATTTTTLVDVAERSVKAIQTTTAINASSVRMSTTPMPMIRTR